MGTRAAGGYVGMSEGWLGTVCALFLRSFNAATTLLKYKRTMKFVSSPSTRQPNGPDSEESLCHGLREGAAVARV